MPHVSPTPETQQRRDERARLTHDLLDRATNAPPSERQRLLNDVVLANLSVARAVARRFSGRDLDDEDLTQVAYEALIKAVRRFDPGESDDLLTYAVPTIRGELQRHFRDRGWMIRPTRAVQESQWRISRAEQHLAQDLGRAPRRSEVIAHLQINPAEYDAAAQARGCFQPTSLDRPSSDSPGAGDGETTGTLADQIAIADRPGHAASEARVMLAPLVRALTSREKRVLYLRFFEERSQREIGDAIGVTQTQVSRILDQLLTTLRERLTPVIS